MLFPQVLIPSTRSCKHFTPPSAINTTKKYKKKCYDSYDNRILQIASASKMQFNYILHAKVTPIFLTNEVCFCTITKLISLHQNKESFLKKIIIFGQRKQCYVYIRVIVFNLTTIKVLVSG